MVPRVSILMTVFNAAPFLRAAIDSVIGQSFSDWELVAVNDGSTDASLAILQSYDDPRIRIFDLPANIGRTPALRYAVDQARGAYLAVLDADDISLPERLAKQVSALDADPELGLVGAWADLIDERGVKFGELHPDTMSDSIVEQLGWTNPFVHSATMFRAEVVRRVGSYPLEFIYGQDCALILKVAPVARIAMLDETLCLYRESRTAMTARPALRLVRAEEELALLREAVDVLPLAKSTLRRNRSRQAVAQLKIGLTLMRSPRLLEGMALLLKVLVSSPWALIDNGIVRRRVSAWR